MNDKHFLLLRNFPVCCQTDFQASFRESYYLQLPLLLIPGTDICVHQKSFWIPHSSLCAPHRSPTLLLQPADIHISGMRLYFRRTPAYNRSYFRKPEHSVYRRPQTGSAAKNCSASASAAYPHILLRMKSTESHSTACHHKNLLRIHEDTTPVAGSL